MDEKLEIKKVPFLGTELVAARDAGGQIWAGVRWMCDGIGLSRNQRDNQIQKIKTETVLSKGAGNFPLPTKGGPQEALCLKLDFVPLWLAKISITPTMEAETPELADRLTQYQLRAKDVLAEAFLPAPHKSSAPKPVDPCAEKRAAAMLLNAKNRTAALLQNIYNQAGVKPEYQALALSDFYAADGIELPRIALKGIKTTYDLGMIAEKLGVYSAASGGKKPHAQAIGAIITQLEIDPEEREAVPYCRHGHDGTDYQYTDSVVEKVLDWLTSYNWPKTICIDGKVYRVEYRVTKPENA